MSGGSLVEFTGDALLAQFQVGRRINETAQAVRAGLRMQRAMARFADLDTPLGSVSLQMRVGLHAGRYLVADIGTARRMDHVLLGNSVQAAKKAEAVGLAGRVCLTAEAAGRLGGDFRLEPGSAGHALVVDDLSAADLGEYDLTPSRRRLAFPLLLDRSVEALTAEIDRAVKLIEPLACYLPDAVLRLLVDGMARREMPARLLEPTVLFVNLSGLPQAFDHALTAELPDLVSALSRLFALINTAAEAHGGVLKKVTCQEAGLEAVIYFGAPDALPDAPAQAARAALAILDGVSSFEPPVADGEPAHTFCRIGLGLGRAFSAEMGEPRGRREYNLLGDAVNTSAHLMNRAAAGQALLTGPVYQALAGRFDCEPLGPVSLKGKTAPLPIYSLRSAL
jgi:class 3 adenylate cyclase